MNAQKITGFFAGLFFAGLFLWLVLRHLSLNEIATAFDGVNSLWISASIVAFFAGYACRIERWRLMLTIDNPQLLWKHCAGPMFASVAINNVLLFRAGNLVRAFALNSRLGITAVVSITTLFVERLLDMLIVIAILGGALWLFGIEANKVVRLGGSALTLIALSILLLLLFPKIYRPATLGLSLILVRWLPGIGKKLSSELLKADELLQHLVKRNRMLKLIFWSVAAWLAEACVFWFAAFALPAVTEPAAAWLAVSIGTLATVIPSTPGYIGTFDYFTAQAMMILGNSAGASAAYAFTVHALLWLPATIVGGIYLISNPIAVPKNIVRTQ